MTAPQSTPNPKSCILRNFTFVPNKAEFVVKDRFGSDNSYKVLHCIRQTSYILRQLLYLQSEAFDDFFISHLGSNLQLTYPT